MDFPCNYRNETMTKEIIDYNWQCDNCNEWVFLGGCWVVFAGKFICQECYFKPLKDDSIDTKYIKKILEKNY